MPDAGLIAAAKAVVDALNDATAYGETFSQQFTAVRAYWPVNAAEDLTTLEVTVVGRAWTPTAITRARTDNEYIVDIGIQQRLSAGLRTLDEINAAADAIVYLAEEIVDYFNRKPVPGYATAAVMAAANDPVYEPEHIRDFRVVTSVVRLTLKVIRAIP